MLSKKEQIEKIAKIVLIAGIFLYPFLCSFFGIDLGDTGIHMFNYENIYSNPDKVGSLLSDKCTCMGMASEYHGQESGD